MSRFHVFIFTVLLILLSLRFYKYYTSQIQFAEGEHVVLTVTLYDEPKITGNKQILTYGAFNSSLLIILPRYPEYGYADKLKIEGIVAKKAIYFPKVEVVKVSQLALVSVVRQNLISFFEKTLPFEYSGLLLGIVFGIKEAMSKGFLMDLKTAGLTHIIAASGMNVTFAAGFFSSVFGTFLKRQYALMVSLLGVIFYMFLAGFSASIVRATIMAIFLFTAQLLGRQVFSLYSLILTAGIMLFISPNLLFDIGFQLSFAATLGLMTVSPSLKHIPSLNKLSQNKILGEDILTTISAQIATLPLMLFYFGTYSLWSVVVNGLVLWTIPILMAVGGVGALVGILNTTVGSLFLLVCLPFLMYIHFVSHFFANLPGIVMLPGTIWPFVASYYFFLTLGLWFLSPTRYLK